MFCMIVLFQYLGWRLGTVLCLKCADVDIRDSGIRVVANHFKNKKNSDMPGAIVAFPSIPELEVYLREWILRRRVLGHALLFDIPRSGGLNGWFNNQLRLFCAKHNIFPDGDTSHCFRRGTASVLRKLRVSDAAVCRHLGWAEGSSMLAHYTKNVEVFALDEEFFT